MENTKIFNIYHVDNESELDSFISTIDEVMSVTMLVAAVGKAQNENIFSEQESKILAKCISKLVINDKVIEK